MSASVSRDNKSSARTCKLNCTHNESEYQFIDELLRNQNSCSTDQGDVRQKSESYEAKETRHSTRQGENVGIGGGAAHERETDRMNGRLKARLQQADCANRYK